MWTVRLVVRVPPDKRQEFVLSTQELVGAERGLQRVMVFQDPDDVSLFCWMADGDGELDSFMGSRTFRAMKGAAEVLGELEELRVLHERQTPQAPRAS